MSALPEQYTTVSREAHVEFEERRSLFIGHAIHTDREEEALAFVKQLKKQYADATHNVYAYLLKGGILARYSDDGEPQGTAGMPVLETIRKSGVEDVCVVVTRYFGGILLGAGGLVRAYSHCASLALAEAEIVTYEPYTEYELVCGYGDYQKYQAMLAAKGVVVDSSDFAEAVTVCFAVKRREEEALTKSVMEIGYGRSCLKKLGERFDYR